MPVIVVTGFLGAGKTTLIRGLLDSPRGSGTAVVVNEFGEIGIDHALLRPGSDQTVLLGNGCLCCRVASDLQETCASLLRDRVRGAVPPFERIVVETSGLADPLPILQTFIAERALREDFHLQGILAVVDAAVFATTVARMPECRRQVAVADRLVVTKSDLVAPADLESTLALLRGINPVAEVSVAAGGVVDPAFVLDTDREPVRYAPVGSADHATGVATFPVVFDAPVPWAGFAQAMATLIALRGPDLLRVKGLLAVEGCDGPVVVHFVQHLAHPPVELRDWPTDDRRSRLVFIVRGMDEPTVRNILAAVLAAVPR